MPFVDFVYVQNKGVAFGLFGSANVNFTLISLLSIGLILVLLFRFFHQENLLLLSLLLAGAFGNIWDRLLYGFVVDFIKIGSFYVFNVADSAISISACWIVLLVFHENRKETELPLSS
jgi:signal peptidase II